MLPISAVVLRGASLDAGFDTEADGVRAADVAVRPPDDEALWASDEPVRGSGPGCLRADGGFIGWLGT